MRCRVPGLLCLGALIALVRWAVTPEVSNFALPEAALPVAQVRATGSSRLAGHVAPECEPLTVMHGKHYVRKPYYDDGWRIGGKNMWIEDKLEGNWMNVNKLKEHCFASGRLKPRVLTKLRMSDHKRAVRYIKRLRMLGLMPYHRLQSKIATDKEAKRPPRQGTGTGGFGRQGKKDEKMTNTVDKAIE